MEMNSGDPDSQLAGGRHVEESQSIWTIGIKNFVDASRSNFIIDGG